MSGHSLEKISFSFDNIKDLDEGTQQLFLSHLTHCIVLKKKNVKYLLCLTILLKYNLCAMKFTHFKCTTQ